MFKASMLKKHNEICEQQELDIYEVSEDEQLKAETKLANKIEGQI